MTSHRYPVLVITLLAAFGSLTLAGCGGSTSNSTGPNAAVPAPATESHVVPAVAIGNDAGDAGGVQQAAYKEKSPPTKSSTKPKFDPLVENGKFFEGWTKPKLALVISGRQDGYLEPCGCAGLENQKGGLSRRYSLLEQMRKRGWPVAAIDVGGIVRRFGTQAEVQYTLTAEALKKMGYAAVGFGVGDLRLSAGSIVSAIAGENPEDTIFTSANVNVLGLTPKVRIIEAGGMKLGIIAVLGKENQEQVNNAEIEITPADEAIEAALPQLAECDVKILLAHASPDESKALAKKFPQFQYVVDGSDVDVPMAEPTKIAGSKARLIEVGHKGMYVYVIGFFDDAKQPVRFQRVALDSRFPDSAEMKEIMKAYQAQLEQLGWEGLGLKPVPHPKAKNSKQPAFASAQSCKECHPTAYGIWSKTKHAHATETLAKLEIPRQYDAECISCHATGWNPTGFFPYEGGFVSLEETPHLAGNSCENCHGPAGAHVAAEKARNGKREAEREALKLTAGWAKDNVCNKCHDADNSPEFIKPGAFEKYWPKIEHKGKK